MWAVLLTVGVTLAAFGGLHLYRRRLSFKVLDDVPYVVAAVGLGHLVVSSLDARSGQPLGSLTDLRSSVVLAFFLLSGRVVSFALAKRFRCSGEVQDLALIVGAGHVGIQLARTLQQHPEYGIEPIGYIDSNPRVRAGERLPAPLLGDYHDLARTIQDCNVVNVIVAFGAVKEDALVDILRTCDRLDVDVFVVPRLFELHTSSRDTDDVWGIPLLRVPRAAFRSPWWRAKRVMDVVLAAGALVLLAPVLVACATAVRVEGGAGIIFRQERVGLDGRPFQVLKFRSLKPVDDLESQSRWNIAHDGRLGSVGRFMRRTSLDELPQLWNVLRGDMSMVGPRPERPYFVEQFATHIPRYTARHRVPSGLTGWAQVHGLRGDTSIEDRARFDNYYIENWSPWLDAKILARTLSQVLSRQGG